MNSFANVMAPHSVFQGCIISLVSLILQIIKSHNKTRNHKMSPTIDIISDKVEQERKQDPRLTEKMIRAADGQAPQFLIISSIDRAAQDLQILGMDQGDAFHATRVTGFPLLDPALSLLLFAAPAAYNSHFPKKHGVIITFEKDEPEEIVQQTLQSVSLHPDLVSIPVIALRVDYDTTSAKVVNHSLERDPLVEDAIVSNLRPTEPLDYNRLVFLCSDSRVQPPPNDDGLPLSIQTLGAHISEYTGFKDESEQLNSFLSKWFAKSDSNRQILIIEHGSFDAEGPCCGAGAASLNPSAVSGEFLRPAIDKINQDAAAFEDCSPDCAEERVLALALATERNLRSYPAVIEAASSGVSLDDLILIITMDTVTGRILEIG